MPPQKVEHRQKWKTEDGEIITLDVLEKLQTNTLDLIAADACCRRLADAVEIAFEEAIGKGAHGQPRSFAMLENDGTILHGGDGGTKRVRASAQRAQLRRRRGAVRRLVKPFVPERKRLIGAKNEPPGFH